MQNVYLFITITKKTDGKEFIDFFLEHKVSPIYSTIGHGMASSKTLSLLGLEQTEKVVMHYTKKCDTPHGTVKCIDNIYNINLSTDIKPYIEENTPERAEKSEDKATKYGEYKWVKLTDSELQKLIEKYGRELTARAIEFIDLQAEKTKNRNGWKSWSAVIHNAIRNNWGGIKDA